jgi:hypothetical protein
VSTSTDNTTYFSVGVSQTSETSAANFADEERVDTTLAVSGNPFDQTLNTTSLVTFAGIASADAIIGNSAGFTTSLVAGSISTGTIGCTAVSANTDLPLKAGTVGINIKDSGVIEAIGTVDIGGAGAEFNNIRYNGTLFKNGADVLADIESDVINKLDLNGGTMIGDIAMNGRRVINLPLALTATEATSKAYVDGEITTVNGTITTLESVVANKLDLNGGTMIGDIAMNGRRVINLPTPVTAGEATSKSYVDGEITTVSSALTALEDRTQNQTATAGVTNFAGSFNITNTGSPDDTILKILNPSEVPLFSIDGAGVTVTNGMLSTGNIVLQKSTPTLIIRDSGNTINNANHEISFRDNLNDDCSTLNYTAGELSLTNSGAGDMKIASNGNIIADTTAVLPETTAICDLGTDARKFKDIYYSGTLFGDSIFGDNLELQTLSTVNTYFQTLNPSTEKGNVGVDTSVSARGDVRTYTAAVNLQVGQPVCEVYDTTTVRVTACSATTQAWQMVGIATENVTAGSVVRVLTDGFTTARRDTTPATTEIKLDATTTGSTVVMTGDVNFLDSGAASDYQPNESYDITFDAGEGKTFRLDVASFGFEHTSTLMYDRLGVQFSGDGGTFADITVPWLQRSATPVVPWGEAFAGVNYDAVGSVNGYIFPSTVARAQEPALGWNGTDPILINFRYIRFTFRSDVTVQDAGWNMNISTVPITTLGTPLYLNTTDYSKVSESGSVLVGYLVSDDLSNDSVFIRTKFIE